MDARTMILRRLAASRNIRIKDLIRLTGITRQGIHKHIKDLVCQGKLQKFGVTRGAWYGPPDPKIPAPGLEVRKIYRISGLQEDVVWERFQVQCSLQRRLKENVMAILKFAFTEILNNAIEHSRSGSVRVRLRVDGYTAGFDVDDMGLGIFRTIRQKFGLSDEYAALQELLKGKATTAKKGHTGEGIFFTSKSADRMEITSHKIGLIYDNVGRDVFVREARHTQGTRVCFVVSRASKRRLEDIFRRFAGEEYDYQFSKTAVSVKIYTGSRDAFISRSEARRLLHNLDRFREIVLDFQGVKIIGQAFADEIFRVFGKLHPRIVITSARANPAVSAMIRHVRPGKIDNRLNNLR